MELPPSAKHVRSQNRLTHPTAIIALLGAVATFVVAEVYISIPLAPVVSREFGVSPGLAAWMGSAFGLAYAAGSLVWGPLSDHAGRKRVLIGGLAALAITTVGVALAPTFATLVALRTVQGFVAIAFPLVSLAYLSEVLPPSARATGIAVVSAAFLLAGVVGQVYAAAVQAALGWRAVFWTLAAVYAAALIFIVQLPPSSVRAAGASVQVVLTRFGRLLTLPPLLMMYVVAVSLLFAFTGLYAGLIPYVSEMYPEVSGGILTLRLAGLPGILLSPFAGRVIHRYGGERIAAVGFLVGAASLAGLAAMTWWHVGSFLLLAVGVGLFVAGVAVASPAVISVIGELGASARGAAMGLYGCALFIGASLGPLYASALQPAGFAVLCFSLAASALCAAVAAHRSTRSAATRSSVEVA